MEQYGCQEECTLKNVVWNVNGLRRKIADCDFLKFTSTYDLVFLSETWISDKNKTNLDVNGYISEHIPGNKSKNTTKGRLVVASLFIIRLNLGSMFK